MYKKVCSLLLIFLVSKWMNNVNTTCFSTEKFRTSTRTLWQSMRRWSSYQFYVYWFSSGALFSGFQLVLRSLHIFNASLRIFDVILHYFGRRSLIASIYSIQGTNREGTISRGPDTGPLCKNPVRYAEKIALLLDPKVPCSRGEKQWLWVRNLKRELIICTYWVPSIMPKLSKISVRSQMERSGSVRSDRNI